MEMLSKRSARNFQQSFQPSEVFFFFCKSAQSEDTFPKNKKKELKDKSNIDFDSFA